MDRLRRTVKIPIGIEKFLCRAAGDPGLRERLMADRGNALAEFQEELSPSEVAILATVPPDALNTMIASIDLKQHGRRRFFRGVAAASLAATTALGAAGCNGEVDSQWLYSDVGSGTDMSYMEKDFRYIELGHDSQMPPEIDVPDINWRRNWEVETWSDLPDGGLETIETTEVGVRSDATDKVEPPENAEVRDPVDD
jgi:hypothetical protein